MTEGKKGPAMISQKYGKFPLVLMVVEVIFMGIFFIFSDYGSNLDAKNVNNTSAADQELSFYYPSKYMKYGTS